MVYKNAGGQSREKTMVAAYVLVRKYGAKQVDVAKVLCCSQATIANWVKDIDYQKQINGLEKECQEANDYINALNNKIELISHDED